jgi:hypothetical protein
MWYNSKIHKFIYQKSSNVAKKLQILQNIIIEFETKKLKQILKIVCNFHTNKKHWTQEIFRIKWWQFFRTGKNWKTGLKKKLSN